ncbi:MAG: ribose-phosphate pyrophosphokinase [Simkania sp.]|nr:ribose-phosphate pyrophosphokinase [Simkania sp.]
MTFLLFSGTSHQELSKEIGECLGITLGKIAIETFPDNEIGVQIQENVRGRDVFVLQSVARHPNLYLMELLIIVDALKRASARSIVAVLPYFGYARQDRKDKGRVPITAKLVANLLEKAGVTSVLTMDLHTDQVQGFFDIPVDNLYARYQLGKAVEKIGMRDLVVVAPDVGSIKLARAYASFLKADLAIVDKRRVNASKVEPNALIGDVKDRDVLLVDDMCSTGETLLKASWVCKSAGARRICAAVTHGLIVGKAFEEDAIERLFVTNTIPLPLDMQNGRVEVVSVADLLARAIDSIAHGQSISSLFEQFV